MIEQTVKKVRQRVSDKDRLRIDANLNAFEKEIEEKLKSQTLKNTDNE
jgi:L-alanine-DL-glutamate epimerase-like enolase superfamily enzyme